jgi:hypothetical protein
MASHECSFVRKIPFFSHQKWVRVRLEFGLRFLKASECRDAELATRSKGAYALIVIQCKLIYQKHWGSLLDFMADEKLMWITFQMISQIISVPYHKRIYSPLVKTSGS